MKENVLMLLVDVGEGVTEERFGEGHVILEAEALHELWEDGGIFIFEVELLEYGENNLPFFSVCVDHNKGSSDKIIKYF